MDIGANVKLYDAYIVAQWVQPYVYKPMEDHVILGNHAAHFLDVSTLV